MAVARFAGGRPLTHAVIEFGQPVAGPVILGAGRFLTVGFPHGHKHPMKAVRLFHDRQGDPDGAIAELTIWRVPRPVVGSHHRLKHARFYGYTPFTSEAVRKDIESLESLMF